MKNNVAYFIASYGKPEELSTLKALKSTNASYPIYIVVGDDDPQLYKYKELYPKNLVVFKKSDYYDSVDSLGMYTTTDKICTYSRLAVDDYARKIGVKYVVYMFDDIIKLRLRYADKYHKIKSISYFNIDTVIDMYIDLLNSSPKVHIVGPPSSSFYMGINLNRIHDYKTMYGNMFVYDTEKFIYLNNANSLEDCWIVLQNNKFGKMSICPSGLQVSCRDPKKTNDSYGKMTKLEYIAHHLIITNKWNLSADKPIIAYKNFTPKIISDKYRRDKNEFVKDSKKGKLF